MAKPDCDDGWVKYAHELDAALKVADFSKRENIILFEVFSQIFGQSKRKTAALVPAEIANRSGLDRHHVSGATLGLVKCGVLRRQPDGRFSFVKDYESWTKNGSPRLSPTELIYVRHAPLLSRSHQAKNVTDSGNAPMPSVTDSGNASVTDSGNALPIQVTNVTDSGNVFGPPPMYPPLNSENGEVVVDARAHTCARADTDTTVPEPVTAPTPKRPFARDESEVRRVQDWVQTFADPLEEIPSKVHTFATSYPLGWIEAAILCGVVGAQTGAVWKYAHQCLLSWWANGMPNHEEIAMARKTLARPSSNGQHPAKKPKPWEDTRTDAQKENLRLSLPEL